MTNRERLISVLENKKPDCIPLASIDWFSDHRWSELKRSGLCKLSSARTVFDTTPNVESIEEVLDTSNGHITKRNILRTPIGEISQITMDGWVQEYFLKTPADYRIMEYIVRDKRLKFDPQPYLEKEKQTGDEGITFVYLDRSPMQEMLVDLAGVEEFCYHLSEGFMELFALQEALMDNLLQTCRLVAAGPGRYIQMVENVTSEIWGPKRFSDYHMPVYEKLIPIFHTAGKKLYTHFDGKLKCISELISQTEIDGFDSLTAPPEGDMTYEEARAIWPDKTFLANINVSDYYMEPKDLRKKIHEMIRQAAPDGRNLWFQISEDLPLNWERSLPVVLEALAEYPI
jgi:hypothetical protein